VQVHLGAEQVEALVAAYLSGVTMRSLAVTYRIHRHTVRDHLLRAGIDVNKPLLSETDIDRIVEQYLPGWSLQRIADVYDVAAGTIMHRLEDRGVPRRKSWEPRERAHPGL
jgi:predicted DNA-binding protein YlxM (UPF0122 family)